MRSKNRTKGSSLSNRIVFQSDLLFKIRKYFNTAKFKEVNTPILGFPTKEYGDGEFLAISKLLPGKFYSLPPSPQLYKQYLMAAFPELKGYYQIAYNFRPELGDATHAQEFRQIDFEISHSSLGQVQKILSDLCTLAFESIRVKPKYITLEFDDALRLYGSDAPDLRYPGGEIEYLKGQIFFKIPSRDIFDFKMIAPLLKKYKTIHHRKEKDSFVFSTKDSNLQILGKFRNELVCQKVLYQQAPWSFIWLRNLPLFKSNASGEISTYHHPQMSPADPIKFWEAVNSRNISNLLRLKGNGCELIVNGMEVGGGNVRNSDPKIQKEILNVIGATDVQFANTYKPLLDLFSLFPNYKSAGAAMGFERLILLLTHSATLREGQAFPLSFRADEFFGGPFNLSSKDLQQLGIEYEHPIVARSRESAARIVEKNKNFIHDRNHILDVEDNIVSIAQEEGVLPGDIFILRLAAHWHDVGRQDLLPREIVPHPAVSVKLFKSWAKEVELPVAIISKVIALIKNHDDHTRGNKNDRLLNILQDGDKLDILNTIRIRRILGCYSRGLQAGQYNSFQSAIFWNTMGGQFKNILHTKSGKAIFKKRFSEFKKITGPLYSEVVHKTRKIIALGGAETISGAFRDLDGAILNSVAAKRIKIIYVPIGVFNNPKFIKTVDEYAGKIEKYYKTFGHDVDFDYIRGSDGEAIIASKFKMAHIIYIAGGDTKFLAKKLRSPLILSTLRNAYRKGAIIIGNSAGILSILQEATSFSYGPQGVDIKGIGLLKGYSILVHYSNDMKMDMKNIEKRLGMGKVIGLPETGAAIFINDKIVSII